MNSIVLAWATWLLTVFLPTNATTVEFYGEEVPVRYRADAFRNGAVELTEAGIWDYLSRTGERDFTDLLGSLDDRRGAWALNDFLFARLVDATLQRLRPQMGDNDRRMLLAQLLAADGIDVRLCYDSMDVYVYARTEEPLYEVPIITEGDSRYVNLTSALRPRDGVTRSLKFHPAKPAPGGRPISFDIDELPKLPQRLSERVFEFEHEGQRHRLHAACDLNVVAWMRDYPIIAEGKYVETDLSPGVAERLHDELRPLLEGKTQREQLQLLASFTRGAFVYKEDVKGYGASKPMIADEVLHYPVSDCEDRSALYFSLVRDLLCLPVLAIAYDDHLSIAVSSPELEGRGAFDYGGRTYHVCDPTGPVGSAEIGSPPYGYARRRFEVVASFLPERV